MLHASRAIVCVQLYLARFFYNISTAKYSQALDWTLTVPPCGMLVHELNPDRPSVAVRAASRTPHDATVSRLMRSSHGVDVISNNSGFAPPHSSNQDQVEDGGGQNATKTKLYSLYDHL